MSKTIDLQQFPLIRACKTIIGRFNFGMLLNSLSLRGSSVEIGTHQGAFADRLLLQWEGGKLYCVDPYLSGYAKQDPVSNRDKGKREDDKEYATKVLDKYGPRCKLLCMTSRDAISCFHDETVDFVYIDGNHQEEHVLQDLTIWWNKLSVGGIMAGHDIVCPGMERKDDWANTVQRAVWKFCISKGIDTVYLVVEPGNQPWSYYFFKKATQ